VALSDGDLPFDSWHRLREVTPARIALGRTGGSVPTRELLDFQLAHALARDAVHQPFEPARLEAELAALGHPVVHARSAAPDRRAYLIRPDLGRRLEDASATQLAACRPPGEVDLSITLSDGLSASAAHRQIAPLLGRLLPLMRRSGLSVAPLVVVPLARVAIQDEVGTLQNARAAMILLGERPGLGSPDSLGAYLVFGPRAGRTDADRNCVSNIRPEGVAPAAAAELIEYLITQAMARRLSGVGLKDERGIDGRTQRPAVEG
jgi:ethanolamine ammonia-lyase small subunit